MSEIYLLVGEDQQGPYPVDQVHEFLQQGLVTAETLFWREGLPEWRPLGELISSAPKPAASPAPTTPEPASKPEPTAAAPEPDPEPKPAIETTEPKPTDETPAAAAEDRSGRRRSRRSSRDFRFRRNPLVLTIFLQVLLVCGIGAAAVFIYQAYGEFNGTPNPNDPLGLSSTPTAVSPDDASYLFDFFYGLITLHVLAEILFLFWVYLANLNSRTFVANLHYTPGWAVGWFFIPLFNLFRPCQVMQEIWKVSDGPLNWLGKRNSLFVYLWFACRLLLLPFAHGPFATSYSASTDPNVQVLDTLLYFAALEGVILLIDLTTLILVSIVTSRQMKLARS